MARRSGVPVAIAVAQEPFKVLVETVIVVCVNSHVLAVRGHEFVLSVHVDWFQYVGLEVSLLCELVSAFATVSEVKVNT